MPHLGRVEGREGWPKAGRSSGSIGRAQTRGLSEGGAKAQEVTQTQRCPGQMWLYRIRGSEAERRPASGVGCRMYSERWWETRDARCEMRDARVRVLVAQSARQPGISREARSSQQYPGAVFGTRREEPRNVRGKEAGRQDKAHNSMGAQDRQN